VIVVLFGRPGSGKGTQGASIGTRFGIPHVSTGEMLREATDAGSPLGREAAPHMKGGVLVPDDLMVRIIEERLQRPDAVPGVVLDGFPRTTAQAVALDAMLRRIGKPVDHVVVLDVPEAALFKRLIRRGEIEHRADDRPDTIRKRMTTYERDTVPVLGYYEKTGTRVEHVDGDSPMDQVADRIGVVLSREDDGVSGVVGGSS
jgi:adenylate kinase